MPGRKGIVEKPTPMIDPITILTVLAYAIAKQKAGDQKGDELLPKVLDAFAQLFGGAAGNAFHGNLEKLRAAFLNITKPDSNQDLERAAARSALHANLFCLMEALGEPLTTGKAKWLQCVRARLPQTLRDLRRPSEGFLQDAGRAQLIQAKEDCEKQLKQIETRFTPSAVSPHEMLRKVEEDYATRRAGEALEAVEAKHGRLPDEARAIFLRKWFRCLCGSFHYEIKSNQPVANILLSLSLARVEEKIDRGFAETQRLIVERLHPAPTPLDPYATVPPLPPHFMDRPEISEPLRETLLGGGGTVALTAIEGMAAWGRAWLRWGCVTIRGCGMRSRMALSGSPSAGSRRCRWRSVSGASPPR